MIIEGYLSADRELITVVLCQQIYHSNEGYRRTTEMESAPSKCTKNRCFLRNTRTFKHNFICRQFFHVRVTVVWDQF